MHIAFVAIGVAVLATATADWTETAPGLAMDYKIHIDAGKEECFFQYVHPDSTLYTSMQVLKGGDNMAGFAVRNPGGEIVHPYAWKKSSEYEEVAHGGGYYAICIDNQYSKFAAKLVNLYITTFRHDLFDKYTAELEELQVNVANFTESLSGVGRRISLMLQQQAGTRAREARDYQLLLDNSAYVGSWSAGQCVALVLTSLAQVVALRRLLNNAGSGSGGSGGPRA